MSSFSAKSQDWRAQTHGLRTFKRKIQKLEKETEKWGMELCGKSDIPWDLKS